MNPFFFLFVHPLCDFGVYVNVCMCAFVSNLVYTKTMASVQKFLMLRLELSPCSGAVLEILKMLL